MRIQELLNLISNIAKEKGLSEPFIVGGLPRDKMLSRIEEVQDIDLTTGDDSIVPLAKAIHEVLEAKYPDVSMKTFPDGHSQITLNGMKLDFSSNFTSDDAKRIIAKNNIKASPMITELLSRDFTVNSLLMDLGLSKVKDPTGMGVKDVKDKIIRTPLNPAYTLSNDPKRIIRVIYLATKLGFEVEDEIISFVAKNPHLVQGLKPRYISDKIGESLDKDPDKTVDLLTRMNLWKHIPISQKLAPYASGRF